MNEAQLISAAKAGDRAAFGELYVRYGRLVHGVLLARVAPVDVEDLMQEVFLQAMKCIGTLRDEERLGPWLCSLSRNLAVTHHRKAYRTVEAPAARGKDGRAAEVLRYLQDLPEAYRETLTLRLVEGMTGPEIAERTGLTHGSVRVNLSRGMELLRRRLHAR